MATNNVKICKKKVTLILLEVHLLLDLSFKSQVNFINFYYLFFLNSLELGKQ